MFDLFVEMLETGLITGIFLSGYVFLKFVYKTQMKRYNGEEMAMNEKQSV